MKSSVIAVLLLCIAVCTTARAQSLQNQMDQMFGQMSTATPPGVTNTSARGVVTGGSLQIRSPVPPQMTSMMNFKPPSYSAGCNGISLYGGSFSYISGDQFVQMLKSIASNAEGLAFQMALQSMSNQLANQLTNFQKVMQDMTGNMKTSCQIAHTITDPLSTSNSVSSYANSVAQSYGVSSGMFSDAAAGVANDSPTNSAVSQVASSNPQVMNQLVFGNVIWQALSQHGVGSAFGGGNTLQEEIMSITGTVIVCNPHSDQNCASANGGDAPGMTFVAPTLKLEDLMDGATTNGDPILSCDGDTTRCMNPSEHSWTNPGFIDLVNQELGVSGGNGIIQALENNQKLTDQQSAFLFNAGVPGTLIFDVAKINPMGIRGYAESIARPIALEMAQRLTLQMIDVASTSLQGISNPGAHDMVQKLATRRNEIVQEYNTLRSEHLFDVDAYNLYKVYEETASQANPANPSGVTLSR